MHVRGEECALRCNVARYKMRRLLERCGKRRRVILCAASFTLVAACLLLRTQMLLWYSLDRVEASNEGGSSKDGNPEGLNCSKLEQLREHAKVVYCQACGTVPNVMSIDAPNGLHCAVVTGLSCNREALVDAIIWDGNTEEVQDQHSSQLVRTPANEHQVWFAQASEVHAPPQRRRLIGSEVWMRSINYARHYGTNADFPVEPISPTKTWPSVASELLESKTHWVLYMSSNCDVQSERDDFVQRLSMYLDVSSVGSCVHNVDPPERIKHLELDDQGHSLRQSWKDYGPGASALLAPYRFRLLIISALCDDYFAEKVDQTLEAGAIPIYLGMGNSHDWDPGIAAGVHPAMIHVQDFDGLVELARFVHELGADTEEGRKRRRRYMEYQNQSPIMFPRHGKQWLDKTLKLDWSSFVCYFTHEGNAKRSIEPQLPCNGAWWEYLESLGKNLSLWGCTEAWPCTR